MPPGSEAVPSGQSVTVRPWLVKNWRIWEIPTRLVTPVVIVDLTAISLAVTSWLSQPEVDRFDIQFATILLVLGLVHAEAAAGVERIRRRVGSANHVDLGSVWIFAAAVLLPSFLAALIVAILQSHLWIRTARPRGPLYRHVFNTATMVLASLGASTVISSVTFNFSGAEMLEICLALLVFTAVNSSLVAGAVAISSSQSDLTTIFGKWDDNLLEIATLALGALVAVALLVNPWLVLLVLPPLLVMHKAVLVRHLEEAASTDSKTGLLNAAAWHKLAERALRRSSRTGDLRGVLVLDLDHFKSVNDTHGHLAGDHVLAAVADAVRGEVRDRDLVGRFGGEEFVVLLAGLDGRGADELEAVAERIRRRVAGLRVQIPTPDGPLTVAGLSVSVGAALHSGDGGDLRTLLQIADAALYAAKRAGRNLVRIGTALHPRVEHPAGSVGPPSAAGR